MTEKIPYLRKDYDGMLALRKQWLLFDGAKACTPVDIEGVGLRMDKSPMPLPGRTLSAAKAGEPGVALTTKNPGTPATATAEKTEKNEKQKKAKIESFDLYDITEGMEAEGFTNAAKFAKRWFDGRKYSAYMYDPARKKFIEGRYDSDMIDTDTIKLSWLNGYSKIKLKYKEIFSKIHNPSALNELHKIFTSYLNETPGFSGDFDSLTLAGGDLQKLHRQFQFQLSPVSMLDGLIDVKLQNAGKFTKYLGMSDVSASLGNFNFYAAVAGAKVKRTVYNRYNTPQGTLSCRKNAVTVTHIYVYARDSYSFHDEHKASQYLGHWNKYGLVVLPWAMAAHYITSYAKVGSAFDQPMEIDDTNLIPVTVKNTLSQRYVYYPIRNKDYRKWRAHHNRGGDFLIYSDLKLVELDDPILIELEEVCQPRQK